METEERSGAGVATSPGSLRWILSSGAVAAGIALWATLVGLLYRTAWLSAFGVSEDLFIPNSATELTYWGYVAMLEAWVVLQRDYFGLLLTLGGLTAALVCLGAALGFASVRYRFNTAGFFQKRSTHISLYLGKVLGISALYPLVIFYGMTVMLLLPFPAHFLGKSSAEKAIQRYEVELATGSRNCQTLQGPAGQIGTCPMVVAQTSERIAFLDGEHVHVIPATGVAIRWGLRSPSAEKSRAALN